MIYAVLGGLCGLGGFLWVAVLYAICVVGGGSDKHMQGGGNG
jgi:hypothetical protein